MMIRIVPDHIELEWLILYALFDIYEGIVSEEDVIRQLQLLHELQMCCTKMLQFYGWSNMMIMLQVIILHGQCWYYVLSPLLNRHVLNSNGINLNRSDPEE